MLLFKEDWDKFPRAILHLSTTNKSFIEMAQILKAMGVENHAFPLALVNPDLEFIDPHDEDLSLEHIAMVIKECQDNPWYFFREILKAPPSSGFKPMPFKINRANLALFWSFFNYIVPYLVQPRQTGKSFSIFGLITGLMVIYTANNNINLLTKDNTLRAESMVTFKKLLHSLPKYLRLQVKGDLENTEKLTINLKKNALRIHVARASKEDADGVGRGLTSPFVFIDEIAYFRNIDITLPVALSSSGAARDIARENGSLYGFVYGTTAGKLSTNSGKFAYALYQSGTSWTEKFYDAKNQDELHEIVKRNANSARGRKVPMVILDFNHLQLGFTNEWLAERIAMSHAEGVSAETDYLNRWVHGTDKGLLSKEDIDRIYSTRIDNPNVELMHGGYIVNWLISDTEVAKLEKSSVIIASDTSDAAGDDEITLTFRDINTGAVLGTGRYNETNLIGFAEFLLYLLERFTKSVLVIERKSSAVTILDYLLLVMPTKDMNPFTRIFNNVVDELLNNPKGSELISMSASRLTQADLTKHKKAFGFTTTGSGKFARSNLYGNVLSHAIRYTGDVIYDPGIISQMSGLVIKNGRIDHASGGHDDLLFSYLLSHWFLISAKNKEQYGMNPLTILKNVKLLANTEAEDDTQYRQQTIAKEMRTLIEDANKTKNAGVALRAGARLKYLQTQVDVKGSGVPNIDATIARIQAIQRIELNQDNFDLLSHLAT